MAQNHRGKLVLVYGHIQSHIEMSDTYNKCSNMLTRVHSKMTLKVVPIPEPAIAERTGTALPYFVISFAVKLPSV